MLEKVPLWKHCARLHFLKLSHFCWVIPLPRHRVTPPLLRHRVTLAKVPLWKHCARLHVQKLSHYWWLPPLPRHRVTLAKVPLWKHCARLHFQKLSHFWWLPGGFFSSSSSFLFSRNNDFFLSATLFFLPPWSWKVQTKQGDRVLLKVWTKLESPPMKVIFSKIRDCHSCQSSVGALPDKFISITRSL